MQKFAAYAVVEGLGERVHEDVRFATMKWIDGHNYRVHSLCGDIRPVEQDARYLPSEHRHELTASAELVCSGVPQG